MSIVQISILGIAGMLLSIQLKQQKPEYALYLCIAVSVAIFFGIFQGVKSMIDMIREMTAGIELHSSYITVLLKMLGITYIAEFASGICRDGGHQTIAAQIEVFSKVTILVLSLPILTALLDVIQSFGGS